LPADDAPTLLFLHIPKAAGTTLHHVLERRYSRDVSYRIDGFRVGQSLRALRDLPEEERLALRVVHGHMPYGIHRDIPRACTYVTILRDPVERALSHYYFVRRTTRHELHDDVVSGRLSLLDYVTGGTRIEMDNGQTRLLSGVDYEVPFGGMTRDHLDQATANLDRDFAVAGLSDRFDETLLLLRRALGWTLYPFYVKKNVTRRRPLGEALDDPTRRAIEACNALDIELHERVVHRFEEALARHRHLDRELGRFRLLNRLYRGLVGPPSYAWTRLKTLRGK